MKLRNRIMSGILSPGAYALWHSFGNPEEWDLISNARGWLRHKIHNIDIWVGADLVPPFRWFCALIFNGADHEAGRERAPCIGLLERFLVFPRASACVRKVKRRARRRHFVEANKKLFITLTVGE